ncbi:dicarboxylate/amino acid:cation symporter [Pseudoalteromonas sp. S3178]|uniref:dicarboxylate/amino acid:cation symporter n=1 Tax=Pseudoalteromonas sp. S3178 TaxID=579532 RepID=UPI00110ABD12|nr:dicarboxylate/amino acid:cation symporter [Pseudoalteromonas sp. S3178]TMP08746.1 dicarboxylate/amino acid:cation symporter [Pseudoalteromonas sp. S3178]|tara:strand:+ start:1390 stop:2661 length:1272 start_codon:yes stop_codon:yes gene_type:complete
MTNTTSMKNNEPKKMSLWLKILIGMIAGIFAGMLLGSNAEYIKPIGQLFISAIKMLIVPLIFCSLIVGVTSMKDTTKMGRIGIKSIVFYLATTAVAISIGLGLGIFFEPGAGLNMVATTVADAKPSTSLMNTIVGLVPKNPVGSLASGNILQIIVFALSLGIALNLIGEKGEPAAKVFESLADAMYKLTELVMRLAPYGVFALMAWVSGKYGLDVLLPLIKVIGLVYLGCIIHILVLGGGFVGLLGKLNPQRFYKGIIEAQVIAFTTTSSSGTLPASIKCATQNLGVSRTVSSFVLPVGATINMDGTALYQGVLALFIAQAFGVDLSTTDYLTIIATATLASVGTAGVPGAGLIMLSLVLTTVGLPLEGIAIVAGIDRILDMARTTINVTGDLMVTLLIGKSEGELDIAVYNKESNAPQTAKQ